jgi:hypothetical protein
MKRRSAIAVSFALVVPQAKSNPLAFFVTPLAEAIAQGIKSTIGFFIKEWLPKRFKDSTLKSWAVTLVTALGLNEALHRIEHWISPDSFTVRVGGPVTTIVTIANKANHDLVSTQTIVAMRDKDSGRTERLEHVPGFFRVAALSGLNLTITANAMPFLGYKEIVLISDGKEIGNSPSIRVIA